MPDGLIALIVFFIWIYIIFRFILPVLKRLAGDHPSTRNKNQRRK